MINFKKNLNLFFYALFLLNTSCGSLIDLYMKYDNSNSNNNPTSVFHWSLGQFVNEWNEPLGRYFIRYEGTVLARFFSGSGIQEEANIRNITFSESEGLTFRIPSASAMIPVSAMVINIIIKLPNDEEIAFPGFYNGPVRSTISIDYSTELRNTLLNENIIIRVSMSNAYYRYQFTFPEKFQQAYALLMRRQSS